MVGEADFPGDLIHHAFLRKNGEKKDLGTVGNDGCSQALGINSRTQIVGTSTNCQSVVQHMFLWENGGPMVDVASLLVQAPELTMTEINFINERGEIVGDGTLPNGDNRGIILIPCDEEHPGIEGCDYSLVQGGVAHATSPAQTQAAPPAQADANNAVATTDLSTLMLAERVAQVRAMMARRRGRFATLTPR